MNDNFLHKGGSKSCLDFTFIFSLSAYILGVFSFAQA